MVCKIDTEIDTMGVEHLIEVQSLSPVTINTYRIILFFLIGHFQTKHRQWLPELRLGLTCGRKWSRLQAQSEQNSMFPDVLSNSKKHLKFSWKFGWSLREQMLKYYKILYCWLKIKIYKQRERLQSFYTGFMKIATLKELLEPATHTITTGSVEEQSPCCCQNMLTWAIMLKNTWSKLMC